MDTYPFAANERRRRRRRGNGDGPGADPTTPVPPKQGVWNPVTDGPTIDPLGIGYADLRDSYGYNMEVGGGFARRPPDAGDIDGDGDVDPDDGPGKDKRKKKRRNRDRDGGRDDRGRGDGGRNRRQEPVPQARNPYAAPTMAAAPPPPPELRMVPAASPFALPGPAVGGALGGNPFDPWRQR